MKIAGLMHEFIVLSLPSQPFADYSKYSNCVEAVVIHDEIISYISDSLKWFSSYNPAKGMEPQVGLNSNGPTVVTTDGAGRMNAIFDGWASLFDNAPSSFELTGGMCHSGIETSIWEVAKLNVDREDIVRDFRAVARMASIVEKSNDTSYILHYGT